MEKHIFELQDGSKVELGDIDMQRIHEYFQQQCTADYIRENYSSLTEEELQVYAVKVRARMDKYGCGENEAVVHVVNNGGKCE